MKPEYTVKLRNEHEVTLEGRAGVISLVAMFERPNKCDIRIWVQVGGFGELWDEHVDVYPFSALDWEAYLGNDKDALDLVADFWDQYVDGAYIAEAYAARIDDTRRQLEHFEAVVANLRTMAE